jgi:hypothetical protein
VSAFLETTATLPETATSAEARELLDARLERLFRRHPLSPVAVLAHLALTALDVDRLRGALAVRALARSGERPR